MQTNKMNLSKHRLFLLFALPLFGLSACAQENPVQQVQEQKILIVYLSRTNNTKAVAEMIHKKASGDLVEIEPATPYSKNYQKNVDEVVAQNDKGILPPLKNKVDVSKYDLIFVGFPTWAMQLPPPIKTFLNDNDWAGKTIAPFNTNAGFGLGSSESQIEHYCSGGTLTDIFSVKGGYERRGVLYVMEGKKANEVQKEVEKWLKTIGIKSAKQ